MKNAKADAQTAHALHRAYERYGLKLTENDLREMVRAIQRGEGTHVASQSHRISVFDLPAPARHVGWEMLTRVRVVYDKHRKTIVTFLHEGMGEKW